MGQGSETLGELYDFYDDDETQEYFKFKDGKESIFNNKRIEKMKELYKIGKEAKVGTVVKCPTCEKEHKKTTYHNVFCSKKVKGSSCKDKYWNYIDDVKRQHLIP